MLAPAIVVPPALAVLVVVIVVILIWFSLVAIRLENEPMGLSGVLRLRCNDGAQRRRSENSAENLLSESCACGTTLGLITSGRGSVPEYPCWLSSIADERVAVTLARLPRATDSTRKLAGSLCFSKQKMPGFQSGLVSLTVKNGKRGPPGQAPPGLLVSRPDRKPARPEHLADRISP